MNEKQTYLLMRKNEPVLSFDVIYNSYFEVQEVYNHTIIPIGAGRQAEYFSEWWKNHLIAQDRLSFTKGLADFGISDATELKLVTHSLSLQNQYWTMRQDERLKWEDINLFNNDFSEDMGKALFYHRVVERGRNEEYYRSPEGSNTGELNKRWIVKGQERYMIKEGGNNGEEAVNEVLASSLAEAIDLPCAKYSLLVDDNRAYSLCKCFTTEDTEIIHLTDLFREYGFPKDSYSSRDHYNWTVGILNKLNVPDCGEMLDKILCIDYVMSQIDRHYNNIAVLHNICDNSFCIAPLYDSGRANHYNDLRWEHICSNDDIIGRPFGNGSYISLENQIKNVEHYVNITKNTICEIESQYMENMQLIGSVKERVAVLLQCMYDRADKLVNIRQMTSGLV